MDSATKEGYVIYVEDSTSTLCFYVKINADEFLEVKFGTGAAVVFDYKIPGDRWRHVAITNDLTDATLYVDGALKRVAANTSAFTSDGKENISLKHKGDGTSLLKGELSEVCVWNRALSPLEIRKHYSWCLLYEPNELREGIQNKLLAYWPLTEGKQTAFDWAGKANLDYNKNTPKTGGLPTPALSFDGVKEFIDCGKLDPEISTALTFEGWFNIPYETVFGSEEWRFLVSQGGGQGDDGFAIALKGEELQVYLQGNTQRAVAFKIGQYFGFWTHLAVSWDGSLNTQLPKLYVNGDLQAASSSDANFDVSSITTTGKAFVLGTYSEKQFSVGTFNRNREDTFYRGTMSDVRLWSIARSQSDIKADFDKRLTGSQSGLVLYLSMTEGFGDTLPNHTADYAKVINYEEQVATYKDDPFDPHAIAALRPMAYKKSVFMRYIDNLVDWGDQLFRQNTRESINEAVLFYMMAYNLLGEKPQSTGRCSSKAALALKDLVGPDGYENVDEFVVELENAPTSPLPMTHRTTGKAANFIGDAYFCFPDNSTFTAYWERVQDRLYKIRHSMNIEGVKQELPLFQPPIDPMALVRAVAGGASVSSAVAALATNVPAYRFDFMLSKAKEFTGQVIELGNALLAALEKKDAEHLAVLRTSQERVILDMNREIKRAQIAQSGHNVMALDVAYERADFNTGHFQSLIDEGLIGYEHAQLTTMSISMILKILSAIINTGSSVAYIVPQVGSPFAITYGGKQTGSALSRVAKAIEVGGIIASSLADIMALKAGQERRENDWKYQLALAERDRLEIGQQREAAKLQKQIVQRESEILETQIEQEEKVETFMKRKFTQEELYTWTVKRLSSLYQRSFQMAYEMAQAAQMAMVYELALDRKDANYIGGQYWDSQKKGLLAGEGLRLDLMRLEKAYLEKNTRTREITRTVSLLQLDPYAVLRLQTTGSCTFHLDEYLYDLDFPGHYARQIRNVMVSFPAVVGPFENINATLTQLSNRVVLKPDAGAAKYLLDPAAGNTPDASVLRQDWRQNQQVSLSRNINDNGLFELNFSDQRYLPFEGTGAVSSWLLEIHNDLGALHLKNVNDVIITVNYTSLDGGAAMRGEVRSALAELALERSLYASLANADPLAWNRFVTTADTQEIGVTVTADDLNLKQLKVEEMVVLLDTEADPQTVKLGVTGLTDDADLTFESNYAYWSPAAQSNLAGKSLTFTLKFTSKPFNLTDKKIDNIAVALKFSGQLKM